MLKRYLRIFVVIPTPFFWKCLFRRLSLRWKSYFLKPKSFDTESIKKNLNKVLSKKHVPKVNFPNFENNFPNKEKIIQEADQICEHHFKFLGVEINQSEIDWHNDFIYKTNWPLIFFNKIKYGQGDDDIKIPWELSRSQHFGRLAQAYSSTKNEKYAQEFISQIEHWVDNNPVYFGPNWVCAMDVAIRACNWLYAWQFFEESSSITPEFKNRFLYAIYEHGDFIYHNLENLGLKSNHYLSDIVGLVYIGIFCPQLKKSSKWLKFGMKELEKEIQKQVYNDGANFEGSLPYHRLVTEIFLYPAIFGKANNVTFSSRYWGKLEKMLEFTMHCTQLNGEIPQIGDNDNGRLHILGSYYDWNVNDHRYLLAIGAVLFNRADFKAVAGEWGEEAHSILGEEGEKKFKSIITDKKQLPSKHFKDCGMIIMKNKNVQITVDAGGNGQDGNGGHCHNDALAFQFHANGEDFIVDPGTGLYTPKPATRNQFRSTKAHSTVMIDGEEINRFMPWTLFSMKEDCHPTVLNWQTSAESDQLKAEHNGYSRLNDPVIHNRAFQFNKKENTLHIQDTFSGSGHHQLEWNFTIHPDIEIQKREGVINLIGKKGALEIEFKEAGEIEIRDTEFSKSYGSIQGTQAFSFKTEIDLSENNEKKFNITIRLILNYNKNT